MDKAVKFLKISFAIGTVADGIVAINWLLMALGKDMSSIISGVSGSGASFEFSMYVNFMFMTSWTALLFWGYLKPAERRGLLPVAAFLLLFSVITEPVIFPELLSEQGSMLGVVMRLLLVVKFTASYLYYKFSNRQLAAAQ